MLKMFFGAALLGVSLGSVAGADDQAAAKAILDQGIKAQGGEAVLSKLVGMSYKITGTEFNGEKNVPVSYEFFVLGDDKYRQVTFDENHKIDEVEVVNGKEGWVKDSDKATENLSEEQVKSRHAGMYVNWVTTTLVPLKAAGFRLSLLPEITIAGRKADGILVAHDKHDPLKLYFDKETHLLVKYQRKNRIVEVGKEVDEEYVYSDFRTVQNIKVPFKMDISWDGTKTADQLLSDVMFYEKPLDEKLFSKP